MNNLGDRLRILRVTRKLSVSEVAERIGVSPSTYREWEYGRKIKGEPYEKLAKIYSVSLSELLTGKKNTIQDKLSEIEKIIDSIRICL